MSQFPCGRGNRRGTPPVYVVQWSEGGTERRERSRGEVFKIPESIFMATLDSRIFVPSGD
eukprot:1933927-Amphidinium_carterae.1